MIAVSRDIDLQKIYYKRVILVIKLWGSISQRNCLFLDTLYIFKGTTKAVFLKVQCFSKCAQTYQPPEAFFLLPVAWHCEYPLSIDL